MTIGRVSRNSAPTDAALTALAALAELVADAALIALAALDLGPGVSSPAHAPAATTLARATVDQRLALPASTCRSWHLGRGD